MSIANTHTPSYALWVQIVLFWIGYQRENCSKENNRLEFQKVPYSQKIVQRFYKHKKTMKAYAYCQYSYALHFQSEPQRKKLMKNLPKIVDLLRV